MENEAAEDWVSQDLVSTCFPKSAGEDCLCLVATTAIVMGDVSAHRRQLLTAQAFG